jgi:hypothetical protein
MDVLSNPDLTSIGVPALLAGQELPKNDLSLKLLFVNSTTLSPHCMSELSLASLTLFSSSANIWSEKL